MAVADVWRRKTDYDLLIAAGRLGEYTDEAQQAIRAEINRRQLSPSGEAAVDVERPYVEPARQPDLSRRVVVEETGPAATLIRHAWLWTVVLFVPLIVIAAARGVESNADSEIRAALRRQFPGASFEQLAQMSLSRMCEIAGPENEGACGVYGIHSNLRVLRVASVSAAILGCSLVGLIGVLGALARRDRNLLLRLFKPGLCVTVVVLAGLILVDAGILIASLYLLGMRGFVLLAMGFGAIAGALAILRHGLTLTHKATVAVVGRAVGRTEAPRLWDMIDRTAQRVGALEPEHVVVGLDPNFFVTEADVVALGSTLSGRTLCCSLSLARILTTEEFVAVVGHELAHFRGEDAQFSQRFFPVYRGAVMAIASLRAAGGRGWGQVALQPALAIFRCFVEAFTVAERNLSRGRELEADRAGAEVTGSSVMAAALVKSHAFADLWSPVHEYTASLVAQGPRAQNISRTYVDLIVKRAGVTQFKGIAEQHLSHPTDSHPPLAVRLRSLSVDLDSVVPAARRVAQDDAALSLLPEIEQFEREITAEYQSLLESHLGRG